MYQEAEEVNIIEANDQQLPLAVPTQLASHFSRLKIQAERYKNLSLLSLNTLIGSGLGFVFWLITAHLTDPGTVGKATSLSSLALLAASFAALGFGPGLIAHLPKAGVDYHQLILSSLGLTLVSAFLSSLIILGLLGLFAVDQFNGAVNTATKLLFISFVLVSTWFALTEGILQAQQRLVWINLRSTLIYSGRVLLLIVVPGSTTLNKLLVCQFVPTALIIALSLPLILNRPNSHSMRSVKTSTSAAQLIQRVLRYSLLNHIFNLLWSLPSLALPITVVALFGSKIAGYYAISSMLASVLMIVPNSAAVSYLIQASQQNCNIGELARQLMRRLGFLIVLEVVPFLVLGWWLLGFFGADYQDHSIVLLEVLALLPLCTFCNLIYLNALRITNSLKELNLLGCSVALSSLGLSLGLGQLLGVSGLGLGLVVPHLVFGFYSFLKLKKLNWYA